MATQIDALDQSGSNTIRSILILAVCHVLTGFSQALPDLIAADLPTPLETFLRTVDLNVNESEVVQLADGGRATVKLLKVTETRDSMRLAVRRAEVNVELNGQNVTLESGNYHLPINAAGVQVDCPVTKGYVTNSSQGNMWGLLNDRGDIDYDFAIVLVIDKSSPDQLPPTIHPAFSPTMGIHPADPVIFKVRAFRTTFGNEIWDFGDGTEKVTVKSDGNVEMHAKEGYAVTQHRFAKAGNYLVRVERTNERGQKAIGHLHVLVEPR